MSRSTTPHHRRRSPRERAVLIAAIVLFVCAGLIGAYFCFARPPELPDDSDHVPEDHEHDPDLSGQTDADPEPARQRRENCYTILLSGHDDDNGGSDTNILVMVDVDQGVINAVSIPRDTLINTDWNVPKFNASYNVGGVERLCQELSKLLGIPVDYYVAVDLEGFVELVDAIGGVNFEVPIDMNYDDPTQDLHIHFSKGMQYLNGEDANILVIEGSVGASAAIGRTNGFNSVAEQHDNWTILDSQSGDFTQDGGQEVMESYIKSYEGQFNVVVCQNDNEAYGAMDAMDAAGITYGVDGDVILISFDTTHDGLQYVLDGKIHCDVECNPIQAETVMGVINAMEAGEEYEAVTYVEEGAFVAPGIESEFATTMTQEILDGRPY